MSTINALRGRFDGAMQSVGSYQGQIQTALLLIVGVFVLYIVYAIVIPSPDVLEQVVLEDRREGNELNGAQIQLRPEIKTGGDYTFQTWLFISNYDYRAGQPKHVFTISSNSPPAKGKEPHVTMLGVLYPSENKLMIRVNQHGQTGTTDQPDLTLTKNITNLFRGNISSNMFQSSIGYPLCDIQNLPLQKWTCLTVVVNGRVIDVFMDGKLARSCLCPGVPVVSSGVQSVTLGLLGGWAGSISTTRFYGYALTPARVYELYADGPDDKRGLDKKYGFMGYLLEKMGVSLIYSGL